jgi:hypothetical protein
LDSYFTILHNAFTSIFTGAKFVMLKYAGGCEKFILTFIALGYGLNDRCFEFHQRLGICLFITVSRPALRPTQSPRQWVARTLSVVVKRPGREADHSPPSTAEVNAWSYTSTLPYAFMAWCTVK